MYVHRMDVLQVIPYKGICQVLTPAGYYLVNMKPEAVKRICTPSTKEIG